MSYQKTEIESPDDYVLLVDESGVDGKSRKILYAGCLIKTSELAQIEEKIVGFNQEMLDHPRTAGSKSWVNLSTEARHYTEDHPTLRELFVRDVVEQVPCRVYVIMADYDSGAEILKQKLVIFQRLIGVAAATRRATKLAVIAESSSPEFDKRFPHVVFRDKSYLPLCVADYYAAFLNAFHEYRLRREIGECPNQQESSLVIQFYRNVGIHIAFEQDISTGEKAYRGNRYFLDKLSKSVKITLG